MSSEARPHASGSGVEQSRGEHGEPPGLVGDRFAYAFALVEPVDCVGAVNGFEHGRQPSRQVRPRRYAEGDTHVANAALGPNQALCHRGGLHREHASDAIRVEAEHDLEHERSAHRGVDRRVRAGEQQLQPLVGECVRIGLLERSREVVVQRCRGAHRRGSEDVSNAVAGHGDKPPLGILGNAGRRPGAQCPLEGVGQRVLGERNVSYRRREQGHEPAVRFPRRTLRGQAGLVGAHVTGCAPCHEPST